MHKFETLLESSVDRNFDRFELYALKNIFGVPEDVDIVLPHYEALDFSIAFEHEQELDDELETLRRQVIAVSCKENTVFVGKGSLDEKGWGQGMDRSDMMLTIFLRYGEPSRQKH